MSLSILLFILAGLPAYAKETIFWRAAEEAPITYLEGDEPKGYGVSMIEMIQNELEEYDHQLVVDGNYKRLVVDVTNGTLTCALGLFKTEEREKIMHFSSLPFFYFFDLQIAMKKELFESLNRPAAISLERMLGKKDYILGVSRGRKYSQDVNEIVEGYAGSENIWVGSQGNIAESLLKMLLRERIDYMFLYPEEATYLCRQMGVSKAIVTVPIKEAMEMSHAYIACSKNAKGEEASLKITQALDKVRRMDSYRMQYEKWISENLIDHYRYKYDTEYLKMKAE